MYLLYTYVNGRVKLVDGNYYNNNSALWAEQQIAGYYKKAGVYVWRGLEDIGHTERLVRLKSGRKKNLAESGGRAYVIGKKKVSKHAYKKYVKKVSKRKKLNKLTWVSNTSQNRDKLLGKKAKTKTVTQYRYADKQYKTSTSSTLNGWIRYGTDTVYGAWGNWSGWSGTVQVESDTKHVQSRKEYRYYYFYCPRCGGREPLQGASDCHKYSLTINDARTAWFPIAYKDCRSYTYSYAGYKRYTESLGDGLRWNFSSGNLNSSNVGTKDSDSDAVVIRMGYRYQTRSKTNNYKYYRWGSWSSWSTTKYTATANRKVETRTVTVAA